MAEAETLTERARLEALAAFLPLFDSADFVFGHWEHPPPEPDGTLRFPYFVLSPAAEVFFAEVGRGGWVIMGFDWMTWIGTEEGSALRAGSDALATATPLQLARLLTALVRGERFGEGTLAAAYERGLLRRIVGRAAALANG